MRRWLFGPVPAHSMVLLRIGLGAILFLAYLSAWPLVDTIFGPDGYAGYGYFDRYPESGPVGEPLVHWFYQLQHVSSGATIWALYLALLISSLCFALGAWPRVTGTLALALHMLFHGRNIGAAWGWATMIKPFLLYAILASSGRQASIVGWVRARLGSASPPRSSEAEEEWTCSAWPMRLLQVHVSCVFLALWSRIDEASWLSGQMLSEALADRDWARFDIDWFPFLGIVEFFGIGSLILELGAPVALWIRPIRAYYALALMLMFAILVVTTSVGWWDFMMIFALTAFLPERWLRLVVGPRRTQRVA